MLKFEKNTSKNTRFSLRNVRADYRIVIDRGFTECKARYVLYLEWRRKRHSRHEQKTSPQPIRLR